MTTNITVNTESAVKQITVQTARVSDVLAAVCPDANFAQFLAGIDPFPHAKLLSLSRCQLHLIGLISCDPAPRIDAVKSIAGGTSLAEAIQLTFGRDLKIKIKAILKKLPPVMLTAQEYRDLSEIALCVRSRKVLAHGHPDGTLISILAALPVELRVQGIVDKLLVPEEAAMISKIIGANTCSSTAAEKNKLAKLLAAQETREAFYGRLKDIYLEGLGPLPAGPRVKDDRLEQITSAAELAAVADDFRNCLRNQTEEAMDGERCFYRWSGNEVAVVALAPRVHHWMLEEVRSRRNRTVSAEELKKIMQVFLANGVAVKDNVDNDINDTLAMLRRVGNTKDITGRKLSYLCSQYLVD